MHFERAATSSPEPVIALHCSGAGAGQWRQLGQALGAGYDLRAPEHFGCKTSGPWGGAHAFTLADEAGRTLAMIDAAERKVHLIGHSYGGGLALHVALERSESIASLTLYEPSAFHLLKQIEGGARAYGEIVALARATSAGVVSGDYRGAATAFVDYWGGPGAWDALRPDVQIALTQWVPKAPLDFAALIGEPTQASAYARLQFPVLIMRGEHAPAPTHFIAETLPNLLPNARVAVVEGAGHMGPLTHADEVNALIAEHLAVVSSRNRRSWPQGFATARASTVSVH